MYNVEIIWGKRASLAVSEEVDEALTQTCKCFLLFWLKNMLIDHVSEITLSFVFSIRITWCSRGNFSFVFAELMRTSACAENENSKKLFPGVSSGGLYPENKMYRLKRSIALPSLQPLAVGSAGARLSKVPKVFGCVLRHNSLCVFKTKVSRDTKLCSYFCFYSLYNRWKDQLYRISKSEFYEWLFGPENSSDFRETGPWSDAILFYPVRRSIGIWWK